MSRLENNRRYRERLKEYSGFGIIYKLTCLIDGKIYIGQTVRSLKERISEHSKRNRFYINNAINKYKLDNFKQEIIYIANSQEELDSKESEYISVYDSSNKEFGYNLTLGGEHPIMTEEVKKKISDSKIGSKNYNYGKKLSEVTKRKMSEAHKENPSCEHFKKRIICNENNIIYDSIREAVKLTKIPERTLIRILKSGKVSLKHKLSFNYHGRQDSDS